MTRQVTLELPDALYEQARGWAALSQQELTGALTDVLTLALMPLPEQSIDQPAVDELNDADLLALSTVQMEQSQGERLDDLLQQQSAGTLTHDGQRTLTVLMQTYHQLWLRQSAALAEAVRRGLRPPIQA
ncbi:MAG: hypothetical protein KF753_20335 [Caldilineaceae bacterium]|nr:hypothetical protein [Caldilineaceae bacterium]